MGKMKRKPQIQFFTKAGCPLCDEAREMLHRFKGKFSFAIHVIDIMTDSALYEQYKDIIPVVIIDNRFTLGARIEEDELRSCLQEASEGGHE
jgi:glutaredoxin